MAVELAAAYISILPSTSKLAPEVRRSLGGVEKESVRSGQRMGSGLLGGFKRAVGVAGGLVAAAGIVQLGKSAITASAGIDKAQRVLTGLYGSAKLANQTIKGLNQIASKSPLGHDAFYKGAQSLAYAGVKGKEATGILQNMGLAISAVGGSSENMERANDAILKMVNAGKVSLDALQQLSDSGVPILSGLSKHFGVSMDKINDMASNGKIGLQDVLDVMKKGTGDTFQSMLKAGKKANQGFSAQFAILKDNVTNSLGKALLPVIKGITPLMAKLGKAAPGAIQSIIDTFGKLRDKAGDVLDWLIGALGGQSGLKGSFDDLKTIVGSVFSDLTGGFDHVKGSSGDLKSALKGALGFLQDTLGFIADHVTLFKTLAVGVLAVVAAMKIWSAVTKVATAVQLAYNAVLDANPIGIIILLLVGLAAAIIYAYKHSETFRKIVQAAWHAIQAAASFAWNRILKPLFKAFVEHIQKTWKDFQTLGRTIGKIWQSIKSAFQAGVRWVVGKFLDMVGSLVRGAAKAFGWVPGIGPKLRRASAHFDDFKRQVNRSLGGIKDKKITVSARVGEFYSGTNRENVRGGGHFATGGKVAGRPGVDQNVARVSRGEWIINARQSQRHDGLLRAINAGQVPPGYAAGGRVGFDIRTMTSGIGATVKALTARIKKQIQDAINNGSLQVPLSVLGIPGNIGGSGVQRWAGLVRLALQMMGLPASGYNIGITLRRMNQESGGNPNAINNWDINAARGDPSRGLMQTIGSTFRAYHFPGTSWNIYDPLANILASMRYALSRYGSLSSAYNRAGGYAAGGNFGAGEWATVGERGPELVRFGAAGHVYSNAQSNRMAAAPVVLEIRGRNTSGLDRVFLSWLQGAIRENPGVKLKVA